MIAYGVLLQGHVEHPLRRLWGDVCPRLVCSLALLAVAVPLNSAATAAQLPVSVHVAVVGSAAALTYLLVLRAAFSAEWHDLLAIGRRLLPARLLRAVPAQKKPALGARCMRSRLGDGFALKGAVTLQAEPVSECGARCASW